MTGDYIWPPLERILPDRAEISFQYRKVTLFWFKNQDLPTDARYIVYFNGVIVDTSGYSGKPYTLTTTELADLRSFAVTAVPPELADKDVIGEEVNMFLRVTQDCVLAEEQYKCDNLPGPYDNTVRGIRPNFIPQEWNKKGWTIRRGSQIEADNKTQPVLKVHDYRHFTNFDIQMARAAAVRRTPCNPYRYVSYNTVQFITNVKTYPLESVRVTKI